MLRQKSLPLTYFLWLFFGWFGLHHFYLRRDRQAFVWWSTFGGYFCFGWFRDLWRIPDYVDEANQEIYFMEALKNKMKLRKKPQFNPARFTGEMLTGYFYGILMQLAIPEEVPKVFHGVFVSAAMTVGVHLVGNIGREKGPLKPSFFATLCTWFILRIVAGSDVSFTYCSLACACAFNFYSEYDDMFSNKPLCSRISTLCKGVAIIWMLWLSFFYFNSTVTIANTNEKIKLRDAVSHFFKSPAWLEFQKTIWRLYEEGSSNGWENMYDEFVDSIDPTGEANAYRVLGVSKTSSEEEVRKAYKRLVVKWHPDRHKGPDKETSQHKFIEIQQAYEILSKRRKSSTFERKWDDRTDL